MAKNSFNPAEKTSAESDYESKFNPKKKDGTTENSNDVKSQESAPDVNWKGQIKKSDKEASKKGILKLTGRRSGKLRKGSSIIFVVVLIMIGVWYSSIFAPNILLVNIKEMYTNDLSDATIALDTYYKKMMNYKIGGSNCGEQESIKCKLSTMSRAQKQAFEKQGFTVMGQKVKEDNLDDQANGNDMPEERYQVTAIIPPIQSPGLIATGDMLFLYAGLSSANKALVYSVFNPKSSFFTDARYKQVIKQRYNMTKTPTVGGNSEKNVNRSFDRAVKDGGGIDIYGRPDPENGISLGALSSPITIAQLEAYMLIVANQSNSFVGLQCSWYSFAKAVTNNAKSAKAATVARFAMQYLKAADSIKAGIAEEIPTNVLASKLAESTFGGYTGPNATDSSMYKSIVFGDLPIPSIFGLLYYLDTFDLIAALTPAWSQIMISAAAQGAASNVTGQLTMPPVNLIGGDREYCLGGEKLTNHAAIKKDLDTACYPQIEASATPGLQGALEGALEVAHETCPPPHYDDKEKRQRGEFIMQPSLKVTTETLSPYVAGIFGANVLAWANATSLLFTSQTKGVAASDALFAGTGQILGDMAMSRGMMPSNALFMAEYLAKKSEVEKDYDEVAHYNGRKNPFDPYNKFSFIGSILRKLTPVYDDKTPLFSTIANVMTLVTDGVKRLDPSANAIYYLQPDPFNPLRLSCPDPEYLAILIMADTACNVRYSFSRLELAADVNTVIDYMTDTHSDEYKENIDELTERLAQADTEDGDSVNVLRQLNEVIAVSEKPYIDKKTGAPTPESEYGKFLQYCVNRQDPWGRSAMHVQYKALSKEEQRAKMEDKKNGVEPISPYDSGDPYKVYPIAGFSSITEGASADQDWYTGKKCTEQSEMLTNFRAWTMICSVDGSLSGGTDCTDLDNATAANYSDPYYLHNDILYTSW